MMSLIASGKTYYVSSTSHDTNPAALSQPWDTWQKTFSTMSDRDSFLSSGRIWNIIGLSEL